jgi:hypothetical protein
MKMKTETQVFGSIFGFLFLGPCWNWKMESETACGEQSSSRVEFSFPYKSHHIEFSFSVFRISLKLAEQIGKKEMKTRTPRVFIFWDLLT